MENEEEEHYWSALEDIVSHFLECFLNGQLVVEGEYEYGVEVVEALCVGAWGGGRDEFVDGLVFEVVVELDVETHEGAEFVVYGAEEGALSGAGDAG